MAQAERTGPYEGFGRILARFFSKYQSSQLKNGLNCNVIDCIQAHLSVGAITVGPDKVRTFSLLNIPVVLMCSDTGTHATIPLQ